MYLIATHDTGAYFRKMLAENAEMLQRLLRKPLDQMRRFAAGDQQQFAAYVLDQLGTAYVALVEARMELPDSWDSASLSRLVHSMQEYLTYPTNFDWSEGRKVYCWDDEHKAYWHHDGWQSMLAVYHNTLPQALAPVPSM